MKNNTQRFSDRVEDYIKYRPHYPKQIIDPLVKAQVLNKNKIIADIGSGTGISCLPFLQNKNMKCQPFSVILKCDNLFQ